MSIPLLLREGFITERCCAYCYKTGVPLSRCGRCNKRTFCSPEYQRLDWKTVGHKHWCGVAGEIGHDYEVRDVGDGKGFGIFALRDFSKNDKIMAERPILRAPFLQQAPASARDAVAALVPHGGSLEEKIGRNSMACDDSADGSNGGLFIIMSRVTHDCLGNSIHHFSDRLQVKILVASKAILAGEEIAFSYEPRTSTNRRQR
uniref:MYND-type domain-containing protein n=1 Tax=Pseudictyota dubia TaxID=2749911 RepID=A0A7R9ZGI6_9STRA|mmetsp:Transcript_50653/g.93648  ORF Transcript_50653/g.93648 Transcript_50653/m.93648 type:complete len:203 (+) Transcript_50653:206-814(+)